MSNCVRVHVNRLAASTCLFFLALPPFGHAQNLRTESQQEFRRIFGFSGGPGTTAPVAGQNALVIEFSADPAVIKKRADLVCPGITLPTGWDDTDATKGLGPLSITPVN